MQTSHPTEEIKQQLEQNIEVDVLNVTVTSENITRTTIEEVRHDVQAQFEQTRADAQRREAETRTQVEKIAEGFSTLTEYLN